jgi:hypothetical protein
VLGKRHLVAISLRASNLLRRHYVTRLAKPLNPQLNLLLIDAPKVIVPEDKQEELAHALVELLICAAQEVDLQLASGGDDELETDC